MSELPIGLRATELVGHRHARASTGDRHSRNVRVLPTITIATIPSDVGGLVDVQAVIPGVGTRSAALAHRIAARLLETSDLWDEHAAAGLPVIRVERFCLALRVMRVDPEAHAHYMIALEVAAAGEARDTHRVVRK